MLRDSVIDALRPYPFRGKLRLLDGIVPRRGSRTARVFGFRMGLGSRAVLCESSDHRPREPGCCDDRVLLHRAASDHAPA
jgi:hypothetical protein